MTEDVLGLLGRHWASGVLLAIAVWLTANRFNHGLNKYHGPFLASLTDWWRFFDVYSRRPEITHKKLHRQYGDVVRLGPNTLSFADPKAIKTIYGLNRGFRKSGFYPVQQAISRGERLPSLFSTTDESFHVRLRRSVNSAFSMSALVQYEPGVDIGMKHFLDQTEKFYVAGGKPCNFAQWLQYYAFDVIGQITYSKSQGFVNRNEDVEGMVGYLVRLFSYVAPVSCTVLRPVRVTTADIRTLDWVDSFARHFAPQNPIIRLLDKYGVKTFGFPVVPFARTRMAERLSEKRAAKNSNNEAGPVARDDLLSQFLKAKEKGAAFFHDGLVLVMAVSMAFAGSETTAISLAAVFYYLLRDRSCLDRLRKELDDAVASGKLEARDDGLTSWSDSQCLPYLDACIKEAFRMHPAAGLPLERVTPPGGIEICGEMIPGNTIVGCSAWIIHRRPEVFGGDVEKYRPERWLEVSDDKRKEMDGTLFQFGAGSRTCIGKNISLLEIHKLVPSFLRRFEIRFVDPSQEWKLHNAWFVKQHNFFTIFSPRPVHESPTSSNGRPGKKSGFHVQ